MKWIFMLLAAGVVGGCFFMWGNLSLLESLSVTMFVYFLLKFLDDLGHQITILDIPVLLACLTWLVMPIVFYHFYTRQVYIANLWKFYMPIESNDYFSFVLPATIAMWVGLKLKFKKTEFDLHPQKYLTNLKQVLVGRSRIGFILITVGVISGFIYLIIPAALKQVAYFGRQLSYVGMFYIYFSDSSKKKSILIGMFTLVLLQSIASGMFGELIYLSLLSMILIALNIRIRFWIKLVTGVAGLFFVLLIQNLKNEYRAIAWKTGSDPALFARLAVRNITDPSSMFEANKMFRTATRMNQGWLIAKTMYYVPRKISYAEGETIGATVLSIIVPRIFWPDKREVGGAYNLKRFWGYKLKGYSMDIGAIGEGYGNFGAAGGIVFMFFYGLLFNMILRTLLKKTQTHPTYLCWLPLLFVSSVVVETDMLNTINSLLKGLVFMWFVFWSFKTFFKISL